MNLHGFRFGRQGGAVVLSMGFLVACRAETVVHGVDEKEANLILEVLADSAIAASKSMVDTGRDVHYDISVPRSSGVKAIRVLNQFELPRRPDRGYHEVFQQGGLIPTSSEEKARRLAAIEGEIERQLKLVEGVLDVEVQIVVPDETALRTTREQRPDTTAGVTVKYLRGHGGARPISEPEIKDLVAAGVEKLTPDHVKVIMREGRDPKKLAALRGRRTNCVGLQCQPAARLTFGLVVLLGLAVFLGLVLMFQYVRLRIWRSRFMRLQNEIIKARRRGAEGQSVA